MGLRRDTVEVYDDYVAAAYLSPAGYDKTSVHKTPWKTTLAIDTMSVCGDSVYALQMVPSTDDSSLLEYQDRWLVTLAIDGKVVVDDSRMPVHEEILQESEVGSTQPPCVNGDIIFVSMQSADDEMEMQNTKSSEHDSLGMIRRNTYTGMPNISR